MQPHPAPEGRVHGPTDGDTAEEECVGGEGGGGGEPDGGE